MAFCSILFPDSTSPSELNLREAPAFFPDLNLDQVVEAITAECTTYDLAPFFYAQLYDLDAIAYRQEVMRDLEDKALMQSVASFSNQMRAMRERLDQANKLTHYKWAMERRFAGAVEIYCRAVEHLVQELARMNLRSRGLREFRAYLDEYLGSESFRNLVTELENLLSGLAAIRYSLFLRDGSITVSNYHGEEDYTIAIEETFEKFRRDARRRYRIETRDWEGMNHIEAQVQDRLALLYPDIFRQLDDYCAAHAQFVSETIARFDHEIQFYMAYLTYAAKLRSAGLSFCYPQLSNTSKEISGREAFDIALAGKLLAEHGRIITNDFVLHGPERIFVISGPNQGGKTTFARMIGQLHYLACLGCPVPVPKLGSSSSKTFSRILNGKRTSPHYRANCTTTLSGFVISSIRPPQTV